MKHRLITITAVMIVSFALLSCTVYASDSSFLSPEDGQIISAGEVLHISFVTPQPVDEEENYCEINVIDPNNVIIFNQNYSFHHVGEELSGAVEPPLEEGLYKITAAVYYYDDQGQKVGVRSYSITVTVEKPEQGFLVKTTNKNLKAKKLKKKAQKLNAIKVINANSMISYEKVSGNKKISVNNNTGTVTVKRGMKKGTYPVQVKVTAAERAEYKETSKTVKFKILIK